MGIRARASQSVKSKNYNSDSGGRGFESRQPYHEKPLSSVKAKEVFSCFSGKNQENTWKTETRSGFGAAARLHRIFFVKISPRGACEKCSACDTV